GRPVGVRRWRQAGAPRTLLPQPRQNVPGAGVRRRPFSSAHTGRKVVGRVRSDERPADRPDSPAPTWAVLPTMPWKQVAPGLRLHLRQGAAPPTPEIESDTGELPVVPAQRAAEPEPPEPEPAPAADASADPEQVLAA